MPHIYFRDAKLKLRDAPIIPIEWRLQRLAPSGTWAVEQKSKIVFGSLLNFTKAAWTISSQQPSACLEIFCSLHICSSSGTRAGQLSQDSGAKSWEIKFMAV